MTVRVRFAPSPTGSLHIGGARTALFNWLWARRNNGTFVLRIEDTDQARSTAESYRGIIEGLTWLGIDWDEGPDKGGPYGPYTQMDRLGRYGEVIDGMLKKGTAYRDYTTEAELKAAREAFAAAKGVKIEEVRKAGFKFTSEWRDRDEKREAPHVIRFKMPKREGSFGFDDTILGRIEKPYDDFDDFVLVRSDGIPLYNFGCVVDDHDMAITLVTRGQEHINSTLPQLLIYEALGWQVPQFGHLPLINSEKGEKLSKRKHPEADLRQHRENGILPEALTNYIMRLGWSHGDDEVISREQLIAWFDFKDVGKTASKWDPKKLAWLNQEWLKRLPPEEIGRRMVGWLKNEGVTVSETDPRLAKLVVPFRERKATLVELAKEAAKYLKPGVTLDKAAASKHLDANGKALLGKVREALQGAPEWRASPLDESVKKVAETAGVGMGNVAQPLRVALTGNTTSPGIGETLELIGKDESLSRIGAALS